MNRAMRINPEYVKSIRIKPKYIRPIPESDSESDKPINNSESDKPTNNSESESDKPKNSCFPNISIGGVLLCSYYATTLGLPILVPLYVIKLGESVNLRVLGASGVVMEGNNEISDDIVIEANNEISDNIDKNKTEPQVCKYKKAFIKDLQSAWVYHWLILAGPLSIPFCLAYGTKSTFDYFRYRCSTMFGSKTVQKNKCKNKVQNQPDEI